MRLNTLKLYFAHPTRLLVRLGKNSFLKKMSDEKFLKMIFKDVMGYPLNLENPQTYNEKLQWLKINDRKPIYTTMVDKYEVKKYIAERIGEEYVIPTIGVWERFEDIDFDALPEQFVLKCTHDSGGLVICRDKSKLDKKAAEKKIKRCLKRNYFWSNREWPYKDVKPRIIAEPYMEDSVTHDLRDYKFFSFDGETKAMFIATERASQSEETKFDFFDMEYNHLPFTNGHPNAEVLPQKPQNFDLMHALADKLSKGIPQIRIDFYEVNGTVYFGEMTFFHWSGLKPFKPAEWDNNFGNWIDLTKCNRSH